MFGIKLFNGNKSNNGFFLELDETKNTQTTTTTTATIEITKPVEEKKAKPVEAKSTKKTKEKTKSVQLNSVSANTSNGGQPEWVKAIKNYSNDTDNSKADSSEIAFASKHLMPNITNSRKRPGPSLNKYRMIAR